MARCSKVKRPLKPHPWVMKEKYHHLFFLSIRWGGRKKRKKTHRSIRFGCQKKKTVSSSFAWGEDEINQYFRTQNSSCFLCVLFLHWKNRSRDISQERPVRNLLNTSLSPSFSIVPALFKLNSGGGDVFKQDVRTPHTLNKIFLNKKKC